MKFIVRLMAIAMICFMAITASGQSRQLRKTDSVFKLIVKAIKVKNATTIYGLISADFQKNTKLADFRDYVANTFFMKGELRKDSLISFVNNSIASYKLAFDNDNLMLSIRLDDNNKLEYFKSEPYNVLRQKTALVASSNPLINTQDKKVDSIARKYIQKVNTVGLSIGIIKNGKTSIYSYGETVKGNHKLPDANTIFELGSITKTFTGTLLAYYVNAGKVSLNDPITKFLPVAVAANPALKDIKLVNLSNHTSGLPGLPANFDLQRPYYSDNPYKNYNKQLLFDYLQTCTLKSQPGEKYLYSNLGVGLLGIILEKISGKPFEQMVSEIITQPLGMKTTVQHLYPMLASRFVTVYDEDGKETPAWDFDAMAAIGSLKSTMNDLVLYTAANMNTKATSPVYKAINLTHQITFKNDDIKIGLGWHIITVNHKEYYFHNGGTGGSSSYIAFDAAKNFAVIILSNSVESTDDIGTTLLEKLDH